MNPYQPPNDPEPAGSGRPDVDDVVIVLVTVTGCAVAAVSIAVVKGIRLLIGSILDPLLEIVTYL